MHNAVCPVVRFVEMMDHASAEFVFRREQELIAATNPGHLKISGNIVDILNKKIYPGTVEFRDSRITAIEPSSRVPDQYILPGFIDAHVHVESSMLIPSEFARMAVVHGTVSTVSDPHEIGNVLGIEGVQFMIDNGKQVPFKFNFGAPSCVPATPFETAGAIIGPSDIETLMRDPEIRYLAEMMNWPGVLHGDPEVREKIAIAHRHNKVVDGHAPGLKGGDAGKYASAGITTDHECFTEEEAIDKLKAGMKIIIREGSAARNFDALIGLLHHHENEIMFCSDDKHPDSLELGHINQLAARAVDRGIDIFKILKAACINPVLHYSLDVGLLRTNDPADFIVVDDLRKFTVKQTFINGILVAENGRSKIASVKTALPNNFNVKAKDILDFQVPASGNKIRVIVPEDGQLVTDEEIHECRVEGGLVVADVNRDILKLAVVNRYRNERPAIAFIRNFNLKRGAIASSVGHDSHNIIAVGTDDDSICRAVNLIIREKGGVSVIDGAKEQILALPVGGIMSAEDGYAVAHKYKAVDAMAKKMGSTLQAPFMTLSFMALLVIPSLKLSDKGLFNGKDFKFTSLFV